ncbi:TolC family protein [soil metagenome]
MQNEERRMKKRGNGLRSALCILLFAFLLPGCQSDFGAGGTGERVVAPEKLHTIQPFDISESATTQASTEPTTRAAASTQSVSVSLTIEQVRQYALQNNLDLKVTLIDPTIARQQLGVEQARFESLFTTSIAYENTDQPTASQLAGSQTKNLQFSPGVTIPLHTGGSLRFEVPFNRFETNNQFSTLNPAYTSDALVTLTQPLLRGFGTDANAAGIRVAFYRYQESAARTKLEVIRVLAAADRAYWRLYASRQVLAVRKQEYDLATAQLNRARRQAEIGIVAEVDVVRAESGVADKLEAIIIAENEVRNRERELKRLLNEPDLSLDSLTILVPATEPRAVAYQLNAGHLVQQAMAGRMELLEQELRIAEETANVAFARNDLLPLVTLQYTYGINGLGASFDDSLTMVRDANFQDHRVGLTVEVPIGNESARRRVRAALASRMQQLATKEQRGLAIKQEVYNAVDQLEANWQRYLAARKRVVLAARVVEVEQRQFDQGLRTSTDVLDAQTRLANARSDEIAALTEHQIAQIDIAFATGTLLGASHVDWQATPPPPR